MDPIPEELLMALAGGAAGSAGQQIWQSLRGLVRREPAVGGRPPESSAEGELALLEQHPDEAERARELAAALHRRAELDPAFADALTRWQAEGERAHRATGAAATFEVSGGTQHSVVMAQNVHGDITLN
ncbi:hypothetical protein ACFTZ8_10195 [Streptomyces fungicidicus]|uniref:hypothetical protein n=1 Tax=Streptomyces TaxID=1883 RepID=UPI00133036C6|nr:hypothetical protein [Streptomyces tendae]